MSTRRAKRPGMIDVPRGVINTTRERVYVEGMIERKKKVADGTIEIRKRLRKKIMIVTTFELEQSYQIFIGNHDVFCMDVQLLKNRENQAITGIMTKVRWDKECSLEEPFEKGDDSILIIRFLVTYVKDKYPYVKDITFTDMSTKECENGGSVNLAGMKVLLDGNTWYEEYCSVSMYEPYRSLYKKMKENLNEYKKEMSFDVFSGYAKTKNTGMEEEEIRGLYDSSATWQIFFSGMREKMGISKLCIWLSHDGWFDLFLNSILRFNTMSLQFVLEPSASTDEIRYRIQHTNGGKRTKKRRA